MGTISNISAGALATNAVNSAQSVTPIANTNPNTDTGQQQTKQAVLIDTDAKLLMRDLLTVDYLELIIAATKKHTPQEASNALMAAAMLSGGGAK